MRSGTKARAVIVAPWVGLSDVGEYGEKEQAPADYTRLFHPDDAIEGPRVTRKGEEPKRGAIVTYDKGVGGPLRTHNRGIPYEANSHSDEYEDEDDEDDDDEEDDEEDHELLGDGFEDEDEAPLEAKEDEEGWIYPEKEDKEEDLDAAFARAFEEELGAPPASRAAASSNSEEQQQEEEEEDEPARGRRRRGFGVNVKKPLSVSSDEGPGLDDGAGVRAQTEAAPEGVVQTTPDETGVDAEQFELLRLSLEAEGNDFEDADAKLRASMDLATEESLGDTEEEIERKVAELIAQFEQAAEGAEYVTSFDDEDGEEPPILSKAGRRRQRELTAASNAAHAAAHADDTSSSSSSSSSGLAVAGEEDEFLAMLRAAQDAQKPVTRLRELAKRALEEPDPLAAVTGAKGLHLRQERNIERAQKAYDAFAEEFGRDEQLPAAARNALLSVYTEAMRTNRARAVAETLAVPGVFPDERTRRHVVKMLSRRGELVL